MAIVEVKNISKSFGSQTVLRDFSIEFEESGVTVILGPSGTGKSTLLRCINGLEKIDKGDIIVGGLSVNEKRNLCAIRQMCGMVFQQTVLFPHMNVLENLVMSPIRLLKQPRKDAEERARRYLSIVGLSTKEKSMHNELSGGEQQRIAIARALMMNPKVLLLDEVTSALDPEMTSDVLNILERLAADGVCMLAVTHEMAFAQHVASRIVFMENGRKVCDEDKETFFGKTRLDNERIASFLRFIGE